MKLTTEEIIRIAAQKAAELQARAYPNYKPRFRQ
jgi:hypothetical protein